MLGKISPVRGFNYKGKLVVLLLPSPKAQSHIFRNRGWNAVSLSLTTSSLNAAMTLSSSYKFASNQVISEQNLYTKLEAYLRNIFNVCIAAQVKILEEVPIECSEICKDIDTSDMMQASLEQVVESPYTVTRALREPSAMRNVWEVLIDDRPDLTPTVWSAKTGAMQIAVLC